jgi:hypothetical protein
LEGEHYEAPRQHESETGNAFDALVRRRNQEIDAGRGEIQRDCAEAAHGIDHVGRARAFHHCADRIDRVKNAGGGFAMNYGYILGVAGGIKPNWRRASAS